MSLAKKDDNSSKNQMTVGSSILEQLKTSGIGNHERTERGYSSPTVIVRILLGEVKERVDFSIRSEMQYGEPTQEARSEGESVVSFCAIK